ncbi:MAG: hypothetical protein GWN99_08870, partial [Gemmatimonadetes bacterium]|nr:hypothetical protein [Gemmatimonadota bacterium]NIS01164.1 hypothetical protein [Gemmatimonadota bacterium]NIT66935.1 hypothetical protein [Gemmatimonadota bacterium]NIV23592.1 hypothetical protein [Gemmatimonadota bacterium]NIW75416.1 hypothetical protein [Gemmatimonadota bacterium]
EAGGDVTPRTMPAVASWPEKKKEKKKQKQTAAQGELFSDGNGRRELPPLELLSKPPVQTYQVSETMLDELGHTLVETLATFKVEGKIAGRTTGPVVTQFEVVPASGVKVGKIA